MKPKLLYIQWADHFSDVDMDWGSLEAQCERLDRHICHSVGWLVTEDEMYVRLVPNIGGLDANLDQCFGAMTILKRGILKRKVLKL